MPTMNIKFLNKRYGESTRYIICGGFTVIVTWLSYTMFVFSGLEHNLGNVLSWCCGVLFAFFVNKWIVFNSGSIEKRIVFREFFSFFGSRIVTGIVGMILFSLLFSLDPEQSFFNVVGLPSKIVVTLIEIALNWLFSKYYVFNPSYRK